MLLVSSSTAGRALAQRILSHSVKLNAGAGSSGRVGSQPWPRPAFRCQGPGAVRRGCCCHLVCRDQGGAATYNLIYALTCPHALLKLSSSAHDGALSVRGDHSMASNPAMPRGAPDFDTADWSALQIVFVTAYSITAALAARALAMRIYTRFAINRSPGIDDGESPWANSWILSNCHRPHRSRHGTFPSCVGPPSY